MSDSKGLARKLGTLDATAIGVGSMVGAGVFAAFTPAAEAAGSGLLIGLAIAAFVAYCNATSSAQLAAAYPTSGGTYVYGRERLGEWPGFTAGWGFVIGKTASAAAMAMTFAAYAAPPGWERPVAVAAVVVLGAVNYFGITRTATATRVLAVGVLLALGVTVCVIWTGSTPHREDILGEGLLAEGWYGVLQSAGLLFFAFAGYARIATMGEEVRNPRRTIPRAIVLALGIAVAVYAVVAVTLLAALGPAGIAAHPAPLAAAVAGGSTAWGGAVVRIAAALASLGALLALLAGIGRTTLAMARERDLPRWLSAVHPRYRVPHRAEVVLAAVICAVILVSDLRSAISFSSLGVLVYYFIANAAAFTQPAVDRRYPRLLQVVGAIASVALVVTLPPGSVALGLGVLAAGALIRLLRVQWLRRRSR